MTYKDRDCPTCHQIFSPTTSREKWCSNDCRFQSHVDPTWDNSNCWEWDGAVFQASGYGQFGSIKSGVFTAHRYSYRLFRGEIPKGLFVCHACDNRKCFNPSHLWVGTAKENNHDMIRKGRYKNVNK